MALRRIHVAAFVALCATLAPLSALASSRTSQTSVPSAAAPIVTGVDAGGGPYLTVYNPLGQWQAGFLPYLDLTQGGIHVAAGDFDGDGKAEIVTAPGPGGRADLHVFDSTGKQLSSFFAGASTCGSTLATGDVNGDGIPDVITGNETCGGPNVQVFDGKSHQRIAFFGAYQGSTGNDGIRVAAGDLEGDGKAEIVTGDGPGEPPTVRVFSGTPTEFFPTPIASFDAFPDTVTTGLQVAVGDVNADGTNDIIVAAETPDDVEVKAFDGVTHKLLGTIHAFGLVTPGTLSLAAGDINGDGQAEILVAGGTSSYQQEIRAFEIDGTRVATFAGYSYDRRTVAAGDLQGKGTDEILVGSGPAYGGWVTEIDPATSAASEFQAYEYSFMGGVRVAAGDLGGDGHIEWVTGQGPGGSGELGVFDGSGAELRELYPFGTVWQGLYVAAGDVNGDRKADIVAGADSWQEPRIKVYDGQGNELSSFLAFDQSFQGGVRVATGDLDGSGTADIIAGAGPGGPPLVRVFDAKGNRVASFYAFDPRYAGGVYVASADLDGDGKAEIIVGSGTGGPPEVRVFDATGKFRRSFTPYESDFAGGVHVAAGDVNGDGKAEIVTGPGPGRLPDIETFTGDGRQIASFRGHNEFKGGWFVALQTPLGPPLRAAMLPATGVEGKPVPIEVDVSDPGGHEPASDVGASIDWGDGNQSTGVVSPVTGGYVVRALWIYHRHGRYAVTVRISDRAMRTTAVKTIVAIADAPLRARGRQLRARGLAFAGVVATFVDRNSFGLATDVRATIDWGEGRRSAAVFGVARSGSYSLSGRHHYAKPGRYIVVVRIRDVGGSRAVARSTMLAVR